MSSSSEESKFKAEDADVDGSVVTAPHNKSDSKAAAATLARRSYPQRERKSTTIHIDGHTVLKTNNYRVKGTKYEYNIDTGEDGEEEGDDLDLSLSADNNTGRKKHSGRKKIRRRKKSNNEGGIAGSSHYKSSATAAVSNHSSKSSGSDGNDKDNGKSLPMKRRRRQRKAQRQEARHTISKSVGGSSARVGNGNGTGKQQQLLLHPIGTSVEKNFPIHGWHKGYIEDIDHVKKIYTVAYVDNEDDVGTSKDYKEYYPFGSNELNKLIVHDRGDSTAADADISTVSEDRQTQMDQSPVENKKKTIKPNGKANEDDESFINDDADVSADSFEEDSEEDSAGEDAWSERSMEDNDESLIDLDDDDDSSSDDDGDSSSKGKKNGRPRRATNAPTTTNKRTKAKNEKSQWERQRIEHNNSVKSRVETKKTIRTNFLIQNLQVMKPFMDDATVQKLSSSQPDDSSPSSNNKNKEEMGHASSDETAKDSSGREEDNSDALASKATSEPRVVSTPRSPSSSNSKPEEAKQPIEAEEDKVEAEEKPPATSAGAALTPYKSRKIHIQPELIEGGEMRDYQMLGLQFLVNMYHQNLGMILGDEMGLGKTLQTISLICYLKEALNVKGPSLVICPLSVLKSWSDEIAFWAPKLNFHRVHSSDQTEQEHQRKILSERGCQFDIILTTYEMSKVPQLSRAWSRLHFNVLILDEGHKIKNHETQISEAVRKIHCECRLLLTGTPLQNNLVELWSLLNFLYPDIFSNSEPFKDAFNINGNQIDKLKLGQAQKVLDLFMIRRLKEGVERLMPKKIETKVYCPLSNTQLFWYKALLMKDWSALERVNARETSGRGPAKTHRNLLENLMMQLRKCCIHPFLFDGAETDIEKTSCEELVGASGKLSVLDMLLRELFQNKHRCVLFSQFTSMLNILEDYCRMRGWKYCRLDGTTARAKRGFLVEQFNANPSPFFIFLMSTRSGGMGLNLQSADTCILFDSDWNPQMDLQAMARVHRIGQEKTVHVYRLISGGTVEERIVERAEKKLLLDQMVNRANASTIRIQEDDKAGGLSAKELFADIKFGSHAVFGDSSQNELPSCDDIQHICDRNRTESDSKGKLKGNEIKDLTSFDANKKLVSTQKFGGIDFQRIRQERAHKEEDNIPSNLTGIAHLWQSISHLKKRQVKNRIVLVNARDSGYGEEAVPVLAVNKDDMERDLNVKKQRKKVFQKFDHSDYCQECGDGGLVVLCPRCPVSVHAECVGLSDPKHFKCCPHHRCHVCNRSSQQAGGMLFPCVSCTISFCEDCLPRDSPGLRFIGECDRFQKLGFNTTKLFAYIHCSEECEEYATKEFGWEPKMLLQEQVLPPAIDVSTNFGGTGDEVSFSAPDVSDQQLGPRAAKKSYVDTFDEEILREGENSFTDNPGKPEVLQDTGKISAVSGEGKLPQNSETSSSDSSVSADEILSESSEDELSLPSPKKQRGPTKVAKQGTAPGTNTLNSGSQNPIEQGIINALPSSVGARPTLNGAPPNCSLPYNQSGFGRNSMPSSLPLPYNPLMSQARANNALTTMYFRIPNGLPPSQRYVYVPTPMGPMNVPLPVGAMGGSVIPVILPTPPRATPQQGQMFNGGNL